MANSKAIQHSSYSVAYSLEFMVQPPDSRQNCFKIISNSISLPTKWSTSSIWKRFITLRYEQSNSRLLLIGLYSFYSVTIKHLHSSPSLCMDWAAYICCVCYLVSFCSNRFGLSNEITDFVCAPNVWIECRVSLLWCDNKSHHICPRLFHKCHIVRATQPAHRRCIASTLSFTISKLGWPLQ